MQIIAEIEGLGEIELVKADDGWYEYQPEVGNGIAINPTKTMCQTYPWEADYICEAPAHKILSIREK